MYGRTKDEQTLALGAASTIHPLRRGLSNDKKSHEHLVLDYPSQVRCPVLTKKPEHLRLGNGINWDAPRFAQRSMKRIRARLAGQINAWICRRLLLRSCRLTRKGHMSGGVDY